MPYHELSSGFLHLDAEITYNNTVTFLATLRQMEANIEVKAINVFITSHGGALMPTTAIVQAIKICRKPVATLGAGYVASAALLILAAGVRGQRRIIEGTTLLLHHPTHTMGETSRKSPDIEGWKHEIAFHEQVTSQYWWFLERCSGRPASFWQSLLNGKPTRTLADDEALEYGLIDQVIKF